MPATLVDVFVDKWDHEAFARHCFGTAQPTQLQSSMFSNLVGCDLYPGFFMPKKRLRYLMVERKKWTPSPRWGEKSGHHHRGTHGVQLCRCTSPFVYTACSGDGPAHRDRETPLSLVQLCLSYMRGAGKGIFINEGGVWHPYAPCVLTSLTHSSRASMFREQAAILD